MSRLILFPVPIGADDADISLPPYNREMLNTCRTFIVEDVRTARRNLKRMGYTHPIDDTTFLELNKHSDPAAVGHYLDTLDDTHPIGLMSEAGLPCVADPGNIITDMAQRRGIEVVPLTGPSSILLALMASGFNGQNFAFVGYLPIDAKQRQARLRTLEQRAHREEQTQIFIETPYRNNQLLAYLANHLQADTRLCVACDLTLPTQFIRTLDARQWLDNPPDLSKRCCVFLLYK